MTLRHMRIFVTVCKTGSTTLAAKQLFMSQPTISISLSKLEEEYGAKLFDRMANKMVLTDAGKCMLQYAEHIVQMFDEMADSVADQSTTGTLRVGTTHNLGGFYLPKKVNELKKQYPDLRIRGRADKLEVIANAILQNELDVAVVEGAVDDPYIVSKPIGEDRLMFICPVDHPFAGRDDVTFEELVKQPMVLRARGNAVRDYFDALLLSRGYNITPMWECGTNFPLVSAVQYGLGISILPQLHSFESTNRHSVEIFSVAGLQNPMTPISVIHHKNKNLSQAAEDFIKLWQDGLDPEPPR